MPQHGDERAALADGCCAGRSCGRPYAAPKKQHSETKSGSIPLLRVGLTISIIAPTDKRWRIHVNRRDPLPGERTLDELRALAR
jgi:hypothetical protein